VLTAVVVSGRVGAAIAAELGTMKVTEQLDALYTPGDEPGPFLAVPRFIACLISIPILTFMADFIGIIGGLLVSVYRLGISPLDLHEMKFGADMERGNPRVAKSVVFAAIIAIISCYKGFTCEGGAEGVGKATTSAVVIRWSWCWCVITFSSALLVSVGIG